MQKHLLSFIRGNIWSWLIMVLVISLYSCKEEDVKPGDEQKTSGEKIFIDVNKDFQTIEGFGASDAWRCQFVGKNWPSQKREAIADLLFSQEVKEDGSPKGIGLSLWRFYIGAGSAEQGEASNISNDWRRAECFLNEDGTYDWSKHEGQRWFLNAAKQRGVEKLLAFTISPPVHYTKNGYAYAPEDYYMNIQEGKLDDYAEFLADVMEHFEQSGITFDYLSPVNETQYAWNAPGQEGTPATNEEIHQLVNHLSDKLSSRGLPTKVAIAEAGQLKYLFENTGSNRDNMIEAFFNTTSPNYVGDLPNVHNAIAAHSYFSTAHTPTLVTHRQRVASKLQQVDASVGYWQSEFCILENTSDIGGGWDRDLTINTALYVAKVIYADLVYGNARSWMWWTALSQYDYKDGLIFLDNGNEGIRSHTDPDSENLKYDGNYRDSKVLWALGNFSRFVRPGMKRVAAGYSIPKGEEQVVESMMMAAFKDEQNKQLVVVFVNYTNDEKSVSIGNLNDGLTIKGNQFDTYTTSDTQNLEKGVMDVTDIVIPARAVVTLKGTYE